MKRDLIFEEVSPPDNVTALHAPNWRGVHISPQPDEVLPVIDWDSDLWQELAAPKGLKVWQKLNREQDTAEAEREHEIALKVVGVAVGVFLVGLYALIPTLSNCIFSVCR